MVSEKFMKNHWARGEKREKVINKLRRKSKELMTQKRIEELRKINKGRTPWNKGLDKNKDSRIKSNSGSIKKGEHISKKTEFKKGENLKWDKLLTKEFLEEEHLNQKKTIRQIAKEIKIPHRTLTEYFHRMKIKVINYNAGFCVKHSPWNIGISSLSSEKARAMRFSQKYPSNPSSTELILRKVLTDRDIEFEPHKKLLNITEVDIFIEPNIIIYCDGDYWHANPSKYDYTKLDDNQMDHVIRDKRNNQLLQEKGYIVLRFWESEIKLNLDLCIYKIMQIVPKTIYFGELDK